MPRMLRFYSLASLAAIIVVATAMMLVHRSLAISSIERLAETSNGATAQVALLPLREDLAQYFLAVDKVLPKQVAEVPLPPDLREGLDALMGNPRVRRIKLYSAKGFVAYSTVPSQIGTQAGSNRGYADAMRGRIAMQLLYRDALNPFEQATEEDNLVQSYIPVRYRPTGPVLGVFEIYTDVNDVVAQAERAGMQIVAATALLFAVLYAALLLVVRRAHREVEIHEEAVREKTRQLQELSRESQRREELERKRYARELQEGIAQTLSAVKAVVESVNEALPPAVPGREMARAIVPELQSAIRQVRSIATDLRPPGLDEVGLERTLDGLIQRFHAHHPAVRVERLFEIADGGVPAPLRIVIYRIAESALDIIEEREKVSRVLIGLHLEDRLLTLAIEADGMRTAQAVIARAAAGTRQQALSAMHERAVISGGNLSLRENGSGTMRVDAAWVL